VVAALSRRLSVDVTATVAVAAVNAVVLLVVLRGMAYPLLGLLVLLPAAAVVLRRPQVGVLALVALVPFHGLLTVIPHPVIVQGWKEALTVFTLVATFVAPEAARAKPRAPLPQWVIALTGLLVVGALSAFYVGGLNGLYGLKVYFFFALVAVSLWRCPFNALERDRLVTILMVDGAITAAFGIAQQLIGAERLNEWGYPYNSTIRFNGNLLRSFSTFDQPFSFGFFVMTVLLVCIPIVLQDSRRPRNQIFIFFLPVLGLGLLTTVVRGAWLGFAVGLAYLGGHRYRILLLAIPIGLSALLFLPADVSSSALSSASSQERATNWADNLHVITANPFGAGIGTTGATQEKVQVLQNKSIDYYQPDNQYFLVAYELGFVGLWWFVAMILSAFGSARRASVARAGQDRAFAAGTAAVVVAAGASSVLATLFQISPFDLLWFLLLAVVATTGSDAVEGSPGVELAAVPIAV
jgi:hypothetical protein